jgi:hypothetical protein
MVISRTCGLVSALRSGPRKIQMSKPKNFSLKHDKRRKHHHWLVKIFYPDGEYFARVYVDFEKATRFAERQKKSAIVKSTIVVQVA